MLPERKAENQFCTHGAPTVSPHPPPHFCFSGFGMNLLACALIPHRRLPQASSQQGHGASLGLPAAFPSSARQGRADTELVKLLQQSLFIVKFREAAQLSTEALTKQLRLEGTSGNDVAGSARTGCSPRTVTPLLIQGTYSSLTI